MRLLVIGSGAREHALCAGLAADPAVDGLVCAPGNAGTDTVAESRPVDVAEPAAIADLAAAVAADLVVIGPELPLVAGAADAVRAKGIACFGPSAAAARLEGSKEFAKTVMRAAGIPTADSRACLGTTDVAAALDLLGPPYVVKDDGLAAGKGVVVTADRGVAEAHAVSVLGVGRAVVVEEFLAGPEVSLFAVTDGVTVVPLLPAQDFKRIGDGDTGPNTGGMGAYCPLPWLPPDFIDDVTAQVLRPTVEAMARRGTPYTGLLYAGLVLTAAGPRVIEFNARFGDPETQVVLALLDSPLGGLFYAAATGALADHPPLRWTDRSAVTVVIAAPGYPGAPRTGDEVTGSRGDGVLHAGTRRGADGQVLVAGGRVLSVTATGRNLAAAQTEAYRRVSTVDFPDMLFRPDIAATAVRGEITVPR